MKLLVTLLGYPSICPWLCERKHFLRLDSIFVSNTSPTRYHMELLLPPLLCAMKPPPGLEQVGLNQPQPFYHLHLLLAVALTSRWWQRSPQRRLGDVRLVQLRPAAGIPLKRRLRSHSHDFIGHTNQRVAMWDCWSSVASESSCSVASWPIRIACSRTSRSPRARSWARSSCKPRRMSLTSSVVV